MAVKGTASQLQSHKFAQRDVKSDLASLSNFLTQLDKIKCLFELCKCQI